MIISIVIQLAKLSYGLILLNKRIKYEKIILLGHSRGGLNMAQFYSSLSDDNKVKLYQI